MSTEAGQSLIDKGIAEARSGNRLLARLYLERAIETPPVPPALWLWLAWVAESPEKARGYLQQLEGTGDLGEVARGALPWVHLMCEENSPLVRISESVLDDDEPERPRPPADEFRVECPHCLAVLYVRETALGVTRDCPACEEAFEIPRDSPKVEAAPPLAERAYVAGTTFAVSGTGTQSASAEQPSTDVLSTIANPDRPVLVADDNPSVRAVAATILRRRGYVVETASDGIEALNLIGRTTPGLVLLDSQMPGMDGIEVCQRLRSHPRTRDLPIVLLSSKNAFYDRVQGRLAGCTATVTKPCDANVLCEAVDLHYKGDAVPQA